MRIIIANSNSSLDSLYRKFGQIYECKFFTKKEELTIESAKRFRPDYIFFPHWSYIIPENIFSNYTCVVFHMTDLPYGRGGSPLQNLISRGVEQTKISAIKVVKEIDAGDIYLKKDLNLNGRAEEIYKRAGELVLNMMKEIIGTSLIPQPQNGKIVEFQRRKPYESNIEHLTDIKQVFDYIRMLDAPDYPKAYIETDNLIFEFSRASMSYDNEIKADVVIKKKSKNE